LIEDAGVDTTEGLDKAGDKVKGLFGK